MIFIKWFKNQIERLICIKHKNCKECKHFVWFTLQTGMCNVVDNRVGSSVLNCMSKCNCGNFKKKIYKNKKDL